MRAAILTVSDRSARGEREDRGGPAVAAAVERRGWAVAERALVADDPEALAARLRAWCDAPDAPELVLTTGGTGLGPRDRTPEATRAVLDREIPGLAERMRREGEKKTPFALLSRAVCGSRKRSLVVNLPGSPAGAVESFAAIAELLEHAAAILRGTDH